MRMLYPVTKTPEEDPKRVPALRAQTETSDLITPLDVEAPSEVVEDDDDGFVVLD